MSVIEDSRKLVQDFLAPELRAISVRLDALEKTVNDNERRAELRHSQVLASIDKVADTTSLRERMARLQERIAPHQ